MPNEIIQAIEWALTQTWNNGVDTENHPVTKGISQPLVDAVREYFNVKNIPYDTFSYDDLIPYLPAGE